MKKTKKTFSAISLVVAILFSGILFAQPKMAGSSSASASTVTVSAADLKTNMRKLWEDHVTWTRNVIFCLVDDLPGQEQAINRLMRNQVDLGDAIKPYYGDAAGDKLTQLLKPHIAISAEVVKAARAGNQVALTEANKRWYANADEISKFLSGANPKWTYAEMKMMMDDHLKLTTDEAVQRIKKNYEADVVAYDKVHEEILRMADMLSEGIVKQFPAKFKGNGRMVAK